MLDRKEKLAMQLSLLINSDHEFSPTLMKGLIFANFKAMDNMEDEQSIGGLQAWLGLMVSSCYDLPIHDEKVISDEAWGVVIKKKLPARTLGNFIVFNIDNIGEICEDRDPNFIESFIMGLLATTEIAAEELEREVAA
jgi:hypothetical protein